MGTYSISIERIRFIFKVVLSGITAYGIYHYKYPKTTLVDFKEYDLLIIKDWIHNGYCFWALTSTLIVYILIYVFLQNMFKLLFLNNILKKMVLLKSRNKGICYLENKFISATNVLMQKFPNIFNYKNANYLIKDINIEEVNEFYYSWLSLSIHIPICWYILGINNSYPVFILGNDIHIYTKYLVV